MDLDGPRLRFDLRPQQWVHCFPCNEVDASTEQLGEFVLQAVDPEPEAPAAVRQRRRSVPQRVGDVQATTLGSNAKFAVGAAEHRRSNQ